MTCGDCKHLEDIQGGPVFRCGSARGPYSGWTIFEGFSCFAFEAKGQPAPIANELPRVHDLVLADLQGRLEQGVRTYGVPLQPHNGRDALLDGYHEALDLAMYLRQALYERDGK